MWNYSYRTPTECWQKTSDFPKCKKLPTCLGRAKEKRKNRDKRIGMDRTCTSGRELWRRKGFHTLGSPFTGGDGMGGGKLWSHGEEHSNRVQKAKWRDSQRISVDQHSPAWKAHLLTCQSKWGLGAEARASEVRPQGEDWGWLREHSLKGASASQLPGKESREKPGPV